MNVRVVPASSLSADEVSAWARIQEAEPSLASPFFRPEFTAAVAAVRDDAYVGVLEDAGQTIGFFPFQRGRLPVGAPVGGDRSNYQGLVVAHGVEWDARALVRSCGLRVWRFHHLLADQRPFRPYHAQYSSSPYMDLTGGYDAYAAARRAAGSEVIAQTERKARKLEREVGAVRFEHHVADPDTLRLLMRLKSEQYRRTGVADRFAYSWNVELLERIHATQAGGFAGMLSVLYAGERLAAVHFGMRSRTVWHYWFPAYASELGAYSPGVILLLRMAQRAEGLGIRMIDLGKDDAVYKSRLMTDAIAVAQGSVLVPSVVASVHLMRDTAAGLTKKSPLGDPLRSARRIVRGRMGGGRAL